VFVEPQPLVIDWEYSGLGERYFDLASSIQVNQLSQSHMRAFLHAYEGAAGFTVNTTVLADWLALVALTSQLWYELHHHLQKQLYNEKARMCCGLCELVPEPLPATCL
jgi:thiamine kinase-like enzyme